VGHEAVFRALVKIQSQQGAARLLGGNSIYRGGLEMSGHLILQDHTFSFDSPAHPLQLGNYSITLNTSGLQLGSRFIIERGSTVEVSKMECEYTFEGTTLLEGDLVEFQGGVRNTGACKSLATPSSFAAYLRISRGP